MDEQYNDKSFLDKVSQPKEETSLFWDSEYDWDWSEEGQGWALKWGTTYKKYLRLPK